MKKYIEIINASQNNLKNIDLKIPLRSITAITGPNGSGKNTLAFDIILKESEHRFIKTLSKYNRKNIRIGIRPDIKKIINLPPGIGVHNLHFKNISVSDFLGISKLIKILFYKTEEKYLKTNNFDDLQIALIDLKKKYTKNKIIIHISDNILDKIEYIKLMNLNHLLLSQDINDLSYGKLQILKLSNIFISNMNGLLYILDNSKHSLSKFEKEKLCFVIEKLKLLQNTILIITNDVYIMKKSDFIIDMDYQKISAIFKPNEAAKFVEISKTANFLTQDNFLNLNKKNCNDLFFKLENINYKKLNIKELNIKKYAINIIYNIKSVNKLNLFIEFLYKNITNCIKKYKSIDSFQDIKYVYFIDIPSSAVNHISIPLTQLGVFTYIKNIYGKLPSSQIEGFTEKDFSLKTKGGRCEKCKGKGYDLEYMEYTKYVKICDYCQGRRYKDKMLFIKYKSKSICDILDMSLYDVYQHFKRYPNISKPLEKAIKIGLADLKSGKSMNFLSFGENQKLKLAKSLKNEYNKDTVLIINQASNGLYFSDIKNLINYFIELKKNDITLILIDNNEFFIKNADFIIDHDF